MCTKFYSEYLKGNYLYVLGVDEMEILKLLLKIYGIGMSILSNRFSTVINIGRTRQRIISLILSKRNQNFDNVERILKSVNKIRDVYLSKHSFNFVT